MSGARQRLARPGLALAGAGLVLAAAGQRPGEELVVLDPGAWPGFAAPSLVTGPERAVWSLFLAHDEQGDAVLAARVDAGRGEGAPEVLFRAEVCLAPCGVALGPRLLAAWSARAGERFDLHYCLAGPGEDGRWAWGAPERLAAAESEHSPRLAAAGDGSAWLVYESRAGGASSIRARRFDGEAFGEERVLSGEATREGQPSAACAGDGTLWVAWTSWRHADYASGDSEIYARAFGPDGAPRGAAARVSASPAADLAPSLALANGALALAWTRAAVEPIALGALVASAYDAWVDKRFALAWQRGDGWTEPRELATGGVAGRPVWVADAASAVGPGPLADGARPEALLLYDELLQGGTREKASRGLRLVRAREDGAGPPLDLAAVWTEGIDPPAVAWGGGDLWIASTALLPRPDAPGGEVRGLRVRALSPERLEGARKPKGSATRFPVRPAADPADLPPVADLAALPGERPRAGEWQAWFGNLHLHTCVSRDGVESDGLPAWNLRAARDVAGLDFAALTDHSGPGLEAAEWREELRLLELWNEPGRFVTFPGYEWTSPHYGHRNVVFRSLSEAAETDPLEAAERSPDELFAHLAARRALAIPHHPSHGVNGGTDWSFHDEAHQRLVEVFQKRGNYEFDGAPLQLDRIGKWRYFQGSSVRDALAAGQRLGFVASPDHGGGLGLAGAWASELTREAVFEALDARRTFGTTGAKLALYLEVNGAPLGSEGVPAAGGAVSADGRVFAGDVELRLTLVAGGVEVHAQTSRGPLAELHWSGALPEGAEPYVYLRAEQADGHIGWSSPVWLAR